MQCCCVSHQLPVSLVLVSVKWWENFVPRQKKNASMTSLSARLFHFKKDLHQFRTKMNTVTSLWNVAVSVAALWMVEWLETRCRPTWNVFTMPDNTTWTTTDNQSTTNETTFAMNGTDSGIVFTVAMSVPVVLLTQVCGFSATAPTTT